MTVEAVSDDVMLFGGFQALGAGGKCAKYVGKAAGMVNKGIYVLDIAEGTQNSYATGNLTHVCEVFLPIAIAESGWGKDFVNIDSDLKDI
jgi:hypothetical protein